MRRVMAAVLVFAAFARWLGYSGFFGSDEVTYTAQAFKLLDGDWTVGEYVGAHRYGVNFPVAVFATMFGRTEFAAALYALLTSMAEVGVLTWVAWRMFGPRAALISGLLLASLPTHVHFAGRLMADAPLCLTLTAAFALFYEAETRRGVATYVAAGFLLGLSFWIKPPVTVFAAAVLMLYPLVVRRLDPRWIWVVAGAVAAVVANCLVLWFLSGNFWYIFDAIRARRASGYLQAGVSAGEMATSADYYLAYLFGRVYHTGLLGYVALIGAFLAWRERATLSASEKSGIRFTLLWALGLMVVLSLFPVTLRPLVFVPKQTNYILIFVAPLCLLAGWGLSRLGRVGATVITGACVLSGLLLALLLQGSVAVFTANSWATLRHVQARGGDTFYVMSNALRAASFQTLLQGPDVEPRLRPIQDLWVPTTPSQGPSVPAGVRYAVVDEQTFAWDRSRPFARPGDVPGCWVEVDRLRGSPRGIGARVLRHLAGVPGLSSSRLGARLRRSADPLPARVYRVPAAGC
jgi:4-amino-4-deoxy-L-arabinose transferase-like glycosyltransferase